MRNSEVAEKNAPATGVLNTRVTRTVTPRIATAATAAPIRLSELPRAISASFLFPPPLFAGPVAPLFAGAAPPSLAGAPAPLFAGAPPPSLAGTLRGTGIGRPRSRARPGSRLRLRLGLRS